MDVDHFKSVNDEFGHDVGDIVLKRVVEKAILAIGEQGDIYRYGGEEFIAIIACDSGSAEQFAERVRLSLASKSVIRDTEQPITASFGVAEVRWSGDELEWVKRADQAMYLAKKTGRNKVCVDSGINDSEEHNND